MIVGAVMVPHPPILVDAIGKGEQRAVSKTIASYHQAAKTLAGWNPDVLGIVSPHAELYTDYFQITPGDHITGDFARFGARQVSFHETLDKEYADRICQLCKKEGFPAGNEYPQSHTLDHGTMVPLYFIEKYLQNVPIVRIGLSGHSLQRHQEFGKIIQKAGDQLQRKVAVVASGDLSHYCRMDGPYGYRPESETYNQRIMDVMGRGAFDELLEFDDALRHQAGECGHGSFTILSGILSGYAFETQKLSFEDTFGVAYGVCIYTCHDPYVELAKRTIETYIQDRKVINSRDTLPLFKEQKAGVFVSIHEHGALRGCIGTFLPTKPHVGAEIIANAISASTQDPRFVPITTEELKDLDISVDVLGELEPVNDIHELDIKKYGILVSDRYGRRGLLLPNLDGVRDVEHQISIAASKAGIYDYDLEDLTIERFEVVRHTDDIDL